MDKLFVAVLGIIMIGAPVGAFELINNGSFETPSAGYWTAYSVDQSFGGWTVYGGKIVLVGTFGSPTAYHGAQSVELNYYAPGGIYQDVPTAAGMVCQVTFAMAGQLNIGPNLKTMEVYWEGAFVQSFSWDRALNAGQWQLHQLTLPPTASSVTRLCFYGTVSGDGGPYLDAVSLQAVGQVEPGDFIWDGAVDIYDFAFLVSHWLDGDCMKYAWCEGTDMDRNNRVDLADFALFAQHWLEGALP